MTISSDLFAILDNISPRKSGAWINPQIFGSGKQTLRFKANGPAKVEEVDDARTLAEEKINELLENFLGINDADLGKIHDDWCLSYHIQILYYYSYFYPLKGEKK